MHWRIKGAVQKVLGMHPRGAALHYRLQKRFGGLRDMRAEFATKMDDWCLMTGHLQDAGTRIDGCRFMEIGSGWYPTFPLALYLGGAGRVHSYDLTRHFRPELLVACAGLLGDHLDVVARASGASRNDVGSRHAALVARLAAGDSLADATGGVVRYNAPADATRTGLDDGSIDVVFSNSVLEHVPRATILAMYTEARRVLQPGGLMFHSVNCGDHYAYVDARIGQLNYLQYSDRSWRFWDNRFLYQNRMRAHEFTDAAGQLGFDVTLDTSNPRPERLRELASLRVHRQFRHVPAEKLCLTSVDFIARPRCTGPVPHRPRRSSPAGERRSSLPLEASTSR